MKRKTLSLTIAMCLVFSLFTWCGLVSTAEYLAPPGSESSIDREPDMRYQQTCYIIPDSVNVAVGQSEYIQTSMGDHQIEHYTFFRWTSSDTSVATVDVYGNVTGVSPGTATINLAFTTPGHMEYDSCVVEVIPIAEGTYFLQNKQTQKYADIENQSMSSGTRIHQWSFHGDLSQRWIFDYIGNGYYTIKSANSSTPFYLGVQNDSAAADTTIVLRTGTITDGMKWKISQTSSGAYKLTAKCGEANNRVLAVGWSALGINIDGIDIEQRDYSNDSDYIDEWNVCDFDYSALLAYNESLLKNRRGFFDPVKSYLQTAVNNKVSVVSTDYYTSCSTDDMLEYLQSNDIVIIHTHGEQTGFYLSNNTLFSFNNLMEEDLENLKFVLLLTCNTAVGFDESHIENEMPINIVEKMVVCGAETVIGFNGTTYISDCNRFAKDLIEQMVSGYLSVSEAIDMIDYSDYTTDFESKIVVAGNEDLIIR